MLGRLLFFSLLLPSSPSFIAHSCRGRVNCDPIRVCEWSFGVERCRLQRAHESAKIQSNVVPAFFEQSEVEIIDKLIGDQAAMEEEERKMRPRMHGATYVTATPPIAMQMDKASYPTPSPWSSSTTSMLKEETLIGYGAYPALATARDSTPCEKRIEEDIRIGSGVEPMEGYAVSPGILSSMDEYPTPAPPATTTTSPRIGCGAEPVKPTILPSMDEYRTPPPPPPPPPPTTTPKSVVVLAAEDDDLICGKTKPELVQTPYGVFSSIDAFPTAPPPPSAEEAARYGFGSKTPDPRVSFSFDSYPTPHKNPGWDDVIKAMTSSRPSPPPIHPPVTSAQVDSAIGYGGYSPSPPPHKPAYSMDVFPPSPPPPSSSTFHEPSYSMDVFPPSPPPPPHKPSYSMDVFPPPPPSSSSHHKPSYSLDAYPTTAGHPIRPPVTSAQEDSTISYGGSYSAFSRDPIPYRGPPFDKITRPAPPMPAIGDDVIKAMPSPPPPPPPKAIDDEELLEELEDADWIEEEGRSCETDYQCRVGESCSGSRTIGQLQQKYCRRNAKQSGRKCIVHSDCVRGYRCQKSSTDNSYTCGKSMEKSSVCRYDFECSNGERCMDVDGKMNFRCRPDRVFRKCRQDVDCPYGQICRHVLLDKLCVAIPNYLFYTTLL